MIYSRHFGEVPERLNGAVSKTVVPLGVPRVRIPPSPPGIFGEMAERLKAHAWKACLLNGNVGSNPTLSANKKDPL